MVAATKRTSTCGSRSRRCAAPRPTSSARSSFACSVVGHRADLVEEQGAAATRARSGPARAPAAPVNAPRAWPNSSFSSSDSVSAAQFSATNGRAGARAAGVDGARRELLAGAGLAGNQDGAGRGGGAPDQVLHAAASARFRRSSASSEPSARIWRCSRSPAARAGGGRPPRAPASAARRGRTASGRSRQRRASWPRPRCPRCRSRS